MVIVIEEKTTTTYGWLRGLDADKHRSFCRRTFCLLVNVEQWTKVENECKKQNGTWQTVSEGNPPSAVVMRAALAEIISVGN